MTRPVAASASGTTDGAGTVTLWIDGPHRILTRWNLSSVTITSTRAGDGTYPTAAVYRTLVAPTYLLGTSRAADAVTLDADGDVLLAGDSLAVVVEGAAPSTTVTVNMYAVEVET